MWPELPLKDWHETYDTLHMWTQIIGKISLKLNPLINHWWECSFEVNARGLTTGIIPYKDSAFEIKFDFIDHQLLIETSSGHLRQMPLKPQTVADFYFNFMNLLKTLDIDVAIDLVPREVQNPIVFTEDKIHVAYDKEYAHRHWLILIETHKALTKFRSFFSGKASPVQFFWGSFDLTVSLFSGRLAPKRPEADHITREGYSHEDFACGFWPGSGNIKDPAFYAYISPEPEGFKTEKIKPADAFYNEPSKGYVLMYDNVKKSNDPEKTLQDFFHSAYEAAVELAHWDRKNLERP